MSNGVVLFSNYKAVKRNIKFVIFSLAGLFILFLSVDVSSGAKTAFYIGVALLALTILLIPTQGIALTFMPDFFEVDPLYRHLGATFFRKSQIRYDQIVKAEYYKSRIITTRSYQVIPTLQLHFPQGLPKIISLVYFSSAEVEKIKSIFREHKVPVEEISNRLVDVLRND